MSYEEYRRVPYISKCACGEGFLRRYTVYESNDWGQEREEYTSVEFSCDICIDKYHIEYDQGECYLVPNGLSFPRKPKMIPRKYELTSDEHFVIKRNKGTIEEMISDFTNPKHRYIRDLCNEDAIRFAHQWVLLHKKRSISPMADYLKSILTQYDNLKDSALKKEPIIKKHDEELESFDRDREIVKSQSCLLNFEYDSELVERERNRQYRETHKYDDFQAIVHYDTSFKKDYTGLYWDTLYIESCVDPEYLTIDKKEYEQPIVVIRKKYKCICSICKREMVVVSSDFLIKEDENGFYSDVFCKCHEVSSFEAKTMDILNRYGISYIREKTFEGLVGDKSSLRFDFALFKKTNEQGQPIIDLLIELQGPHHYKSGHYDEDGDYIITTKTESSDMERFERQKKYDEIKKQFSCYNGIDLELIKYTSSDYEVLENRIDSILRKHGYITET